MNVRYSTALVLLILFPIGLLTIFGFRLLQGELERIEKAFESIVVSRLKQIDSKLQHFLLEQRRNLTEFTAVSKFPSIASPTENSLILESFCKAPDGEFSFFPVSHPSRTSFLVRNSENFSGRILANISTITSAIPPNQTGVNLSLNREGKAIQTKSAWLNYNVSPHEDVDPSTGKTSYSGWFPWTEGFENHLLYWHVRQDGSFVGADISLNILFSRFYGSYIPELTLDLPWQEGCITLCDSKNQKVYRWGNYEPKTLEKPRVLMILREPLQTWNLQFHTPIETITENLHSGVYFNLLAILLLVVLVIGFLGYYVHLESTREMRDAREKVSFVNQVSHELKTPLTNIRMYVELLQMQLGEGFSEEQELVTVAITEIHRLSRLIHNVLTFSKCQQGRLRLNVQSVVPDKIIRDTLEIFRPLLTSKSLRVQCDLQTPEEMKFDPDVLEQILSNLFSNVEKYASKGGMLWVKSLFSPPFLKIWVFDQGAGIPPDRIEFIFQPFSRLGESLSEGASGTGLGLTISRDLARLHGGDLNLHWSNGKVFGNPEENVDFSPPTGSGFLVKIKIDS